MLQVVKSLSAFGCPNWRTPSLLRSSLSPPDFALDLDAGLDRLAALSALYGSFFRRLCFDQTALVWMIPIDRPLQSSRGCTSLVRRRFAGPHPLFSRSALMRS